MMLGLVRSGSIKPTRWDLRIEESARIRVICGQLFGCLMAQANHCSAELVERRHVSANLVVLRFHVAERLSFTAGQFATIGIAADGEVIERPYSIVSSPHEPFLEFFVELVTGGILT